VTRVHGSGRAVTVARPATKLAAGMMLVGASCGHQTVTMALGRDAEAPCFEVLEQIALCELWRACPGCGEIALLCAAVLLERVN
jgi:hypothetical protein